MALSKNELKVLLDQGHLAFEPDIDGFQIQPNSIDLRLGWSFYIPKTWKFDDRGRVGVSMDYLDDRTKKDNFDLIKLKPGQYFEILPKEFVIASSFEKVRLNSDKLMAILHVRSSLVRRGLLIASGVVDLHYQGQLTLPIMNQTDNQIVRLYPGERICQLVFEEAPSGLSPEEARKHGLNGAKYHHSTAYSLEGKSDSQEEIELIRQGKIQQLKDSFKR